MTVVNMGIAKIVAILPVRHCQKKLQRAGLGTVDTAAPDSNSKEMAECKLALRHKSRMDRLRLTPCVPSA